MLLVMIASVNYRSQRSIEGEKGYKGGGGWRRKKKENKNVVLARVMTALARKHDRKRTQTGLARVYIRARACGHVLSGEC